MGFLLKLLPSRAWERLMLAICIGGLAVAGVTALHRYGDRRERAGADGVQVRFDRYVQDQQEAALRAAKDREAEDKRRAAALVQLIDKHAEETHQANADATAARAAGQRLRDRIAALTADRDQPTDDPALAECRQTKAAIGDVLRSCQSRYEELGREADSSFIAGAACERAYDSLTSAGDAPDTQEEPTGPDSAGVGG